MTRYVLALLIAVALLSLVATAAQADELPTPTVTQLLELSEAAEEAGERDLQEQYIRQALALAEATGDAEGLADSWRFLSFMHMAASEMQLAIDDLQQSLQVSEHAGNQRGISLALVNLGMIFSEVGMFAHSVDHLRRAIALQEQMGFNEDLRAALNNLAIVEEALGNDEEAERLYSRVYQLAVADDDTVDQMYYYINIVDILVKREQFQLAEANLLRALELNDGEQTSELAYIYLYLGEVAMMRDNVEEAGEFYAKGLAVGQAAGSASGRTNALFSNARYRFQIGDLTSAEDYAQQARSIAVDAGINTYTYQVFELLTDIAQAQQDYASALEYHKEFVRYRDLVFNEESARELQRQRMQSEFDKRRALSEAEIRRKSIQRNFSVAGLLLALLFMLVVLAQRNRIRIERDRSENLLLNILPYETAQELKQKGYSEAQTIQQVSVLFTDFSGFTQLSERLTPKELVAAIHECFSAFDEIMDRHGVEKIKTIGDAYMAAGGLPTVNTTNALDVVRAALEIQAYMQQHAIEKAAAGLPYFEIRIGVHTGPVVAGIVGIKKFQYDIWGDTVNTASRMESSGAVGRVNVSETTQRLVCKDFEFEFRGQIEAKGKGKIAMYFVNGSPAQPPKHAAEQLSESPPA